ncbi:pentatricopeptide repeat-containing protein At5g15010, mitochondrial-like [Tasmannia lanceolata]|uniref:pentatricopeptide repeat-containing protein At5g15010, mitochondrial-like n=1 Tax=Tasmannia lanceolata TaxID=3420 RepID=UPI00406493FD
MSHKRRAIDDPPLSEQYKRIQTQTANPLLFPPSNAIPSGSSIPSPQPRKRPTFVSYLETPNLPPKTKLLCDILSNTPSTNVENTLNDTGIRVTPEDVEEVLKLSYGSPGPAVKFFRWAGRQLSDKHSPYAWNLIVDLLGKNLLFDAMWDAIKSMNNEGLLSLATFASVFSSYVVADRVNEALMTFEVMDQYGCPRDIVALNSLLSAICRDGKTSNARDFLDTVKGKIRPDADTYAILLEGWENGGDVASARQTFGEMVILIGWDPENVPAYDSFLNTLLKGSKSPGNIDEAMKFFSIMKENRCYPGLKFLRNVLEEYSKSSNVRDSSALWKEMVGRFARAASSLWKEIVGRNGCIPDTGMYNSMIALQCHLNNVDMAYRLLDEMVFDGAFPDSQTYNVMLQSLIKSRKLREASVIYNEMVKNECLPDYSNCDSAIRVYLDFGDSDMAIRVWKCMVENDITPLEDSGNSLIVGLRDNVRLSEACKYAEDMINRGIKLNSSTLSKLKASLLKARKGNAYDQLLRKWKSH